MDITLIAITTLILIAIVFISLFLFNSINKKSYTAEDGSVFDNKSDFYLYKNLYNKTMPLFIPDNGKGSSQEILGFEKQFLSKLTAEGFSDLKTLVKYRKQIKSLSDLINT
tara:strand:+ start:388 stop:720 length:333 start_codon:yes stop_codon:yes gene_type:complete